MATFLSAKKIENPDLWV